MRVLFYPVFGEQASLTDHFCRAHWYLRPFAARLSDVVLAHTGETLGPRPEYLDASFSVDDNFVSLHPVADQAELDARVRDADIILLWDNAHADAPVLRGKKIVRIDHGANQHASSYYLKVAERFFPDLQAEYQRASRKVFARIAARCKSQIGYIFGTGPGLAHAAGHDFSDGVSIACNSMVRNHDLMERLKPPLIVVGDPIFHAGPSSYAAAFRAALIAAMDRYNSDLVVPMRDYHIYLAHLPARFADRICAIPFEPAEAPNLDLTRALHVSTTSNVLTLFLVPLAATFFEQIRIFGCDGRPLDQNTYFWSHDKASQFNDEMGAIQRAHPAFFAIDYDDYYLKHCATLETWLAAAEAAGKQVSNHTQSYIPALLKRSVEGVGEPVREDAPPAPTVSIIMPAYNTAEFIEEAVRSLIAQDFTDWELLIVEDGSSDETFDVAKQLASEDARVKVMRNPRKGVSSARNTGVEAARGRFIGFLDSDDTMDPGSLSARVAALSADSAPPLVHSVARRTDENGRDLESPYGVGADLSFADMWRNPAHINTIMGRAELIRAFPFPESIANGEDWLMFAQMLRSGAVSKFVPEGGVTWRIQGRSTTFRAMRRHEAGLVGVLDWVYAPAEDGKAAPQFARGLTTPEKADVLRERAYGLLVWNILCGDLEGARQILLQDDTLEWRMARAPERRSVAVEAAAVRLFRRTRAELRTLPASERKRIAAAIEALDLPRIDRLLAETLSRVFELDALAEPTRVVTLRSAPRPAHTVLSVAHALPHAAEDVFACDEVVDDWQTYQCDVRAQQASFALGGPDVRRPASRLIENEALGVHGVRKLFNVTKPGRVEVGGFVRPAGRNAAGLWVGEEGVGVIFDVRNCAVGHANPCARFPMLDAEIAGSASEWGQWRHIRVVILMAEPAPLLVQLNLRESVRGPTRYTGNGRAGLDVWGMYGVVLDAHGAVTAA